MLPTTLARGLLGTVLVTCPTDVVALVNGPVTGRAARVACRALGARHVLEAIVLASLRGSREPSFVGAVDLLHAASMGALAWWAPSYRRLAAMSALIATAFAATSLATRRLPDREG